MKRRRRSDWREKEGGGEAWKTRVSDSVVTTARVKVELDNRLETDDDDAGSGFNTSPTSSEREYSQFMRNWRCRFPFRLHRDMFGCASRSGYDDPINGRLKVLARDLMA